MKNENENEKGQERECVCGNCIYYKYLFGKCTSGVRNISIQDVNTRCVTGSFKHFKEPEISVFLKPKSSRCDRRCCSDCDCGES